MILIAESGSTKTDWIVLDHTHQIVLHTQTTGLNPAVLAEEEIVRRIRADKALVHYHDKIEILHFYGAGCGTDLPKQLMRETLVTIFKNATIEVFEDMRAAVLSVTENPGIVCILGTGSNSCYFDGEHINQPIPSLGYSIMDEAGGMYFGRELIRDYFYRRMPEEVAAAFESRFDLDPDAIKKNLYKKPHPNAYLASFAPFIFECQEQGMAKHYFYNLVRKGIATFIESRILTFGNVHEVPIHFIGSIAYFSQEIIKECIAAYNLTMGTVLRRPIDGLIAYYKKKNNTDFLNQ